MKRRFLALAAAFSCIALSSASAATIAIAAGNPSADAINGHDIRVFASGLNGAQFLSASALDLSTEASDGVDVTLTGFRNQFGQFYGDYRIETGPVADDSFAFGATRFAGQFQFRNPTTSSLTVGIQGSVQAFGTIRDQDTTFPDLIQSGISFVQDGTPIVSVFAGGAGVTGFNTYINRRFTFDVAPGATTTIDFAVTARAEVNTGAISPVPLPGSAFALLASFAALLTLRRSRHTGRIFRDGDLLRG